jgi:sugar lactone lactonase YvrE
LSARFSSIEGLAFDDSGNLFVTSGWAIRRIGNDGMTTTVAGGAWAGTSVDGDGAAARVVGARALARLPGTLGFVFSEWQGAVRRVTAAGAVRRLAGVTPGAGSVDGIGTAARLNWPKRVIAANDGTLYVATAGAVRSIGTEGEVATLASTVAGASVFDATDLALAPGGSLVVADAASLMLHRVSSAGAISALAGTEDVYGSADGPLGTGRFWGPEGVAVDADGVAYVADSFNHTIRRVEVDGRITTFAGSPGQPGAVNGVGAAARFSNPRAVVVDASGNVFVADDSHTIRRITPAGTVTTYAGVLGSWGYSEGRVARFRNSSGMAFDAAGNLYVADAGNNLVRRITPDGYTTTVMGRYGTAALLPGAAGAINAPWGVAVRPGGRLVVVTEQAIVSD